MLHSFAHDQNITIVRPGVERLTATNSKMFKDQSIAIYEDGATHMLFDFGRISFVDSSALGALVGVLKKIGMRGDMSICGLNADVARMFRICRMDEVFRIYADREAAIREIGAAQ